MKVNFLVDDIKTLKYIGSTTSPKYFYEYLKNKIEVDINGRQENYDIIHAHSITPWMIKKAINYQKKGAVIIYSVHSMPYTNEGNTLGIKSLEKIYYKKAFSKFDHLIAVSDQVMTELRKEGFNNVKLCPNAIDTNYFKKSNKMRKELRKELGINKEKLIINVAQVNPRKGVYEFIKLAKMHPEKKFAWFGGTPFGLLTKDYFRIKKIMKTKYDNLIFYGYINDSRKAYSAGDVFLSPSKSETFGLTIIEAASCGLPVIINDLSVYKKLFNKKAYYSRTLNDYSININKAIKKNKSINLAKKYDIKNQGMKLLRIYESILPKKQPFLTKQVRNY